MYPLPIPTQIFQKLPPLGGEGEEYSARNAWYVYIYIYIYMTLARSLLRKTGGKRPVLFSEISGFFWDIFVGFFSQKRTFFLADYIQKTYRSTNSDSGSNYSFNVLISGPLHNNKYKL